MTFVLASGSPLRVLPHTHEQSEINGLVADLQAINDTFNSYMLLSGGTYTGPVLMAQDPTTAMQAATKQYVDSMIQGLDPKDAAKAATTANITLSGLQTIDTIALADGDRVLVKDQTDATENGIYVASAGTWSRSDDADDSASVTSGLFVLVEQGTANAGTGWVITGITGAVNVGTDNINFTKFTSKGDVTIVAGDGINVNESGFQYTITAEVTQADFDAGMATKAELNHGHVSRDTQFYFAGQLPNDYDQNYFWSTSVGLGVTGAPSNYVYIANLGGDGAGFGLQLAAKFSASDDYYIRRRADNAAAPNGANVWQPWVSLWHSGNFDPTDYLGVNATAAAATKLATARDISLGGVLSGSAAFDGSGNVTITASIGTLNLGDLSNVDTASASIGQVLKKTGANTFAFGDESSAPVTSVDSLTGAVDLSGRYYTQTQVTGFLNNKLNLSGGTLTGALTLPYFDFTTGTGPGVGPEAHGRGYMYNHATYGLVAGGVGSTDDTLWINKSGSTVWRNPTGTINVEFAGTIKEGGTLLSAKYLGINAQASDSNALQGYAPSTASTANTIVRRDASGHSSFQEVFCTYPNLSHTQITRDSDTVFYSSTDNYIRKNTAVGFKTSLGLNNVDNTSDANKPVSTAMQTALDAKLSLSGGTMTGSVGFASNYGVTYGSAGTLHGYYPFRDLSGWTNVGSAPNTLGSLLLSDELLFFAESDSNNVRGWMDLNGGTFRWINTANFGTLQEGGTSLADKYLAKAGGDLTGGITHALETISGTDLDFSKQGGTKTITANVSFAFTNVPANGKYTQYLLILTDGGAHTITWPGAVSWDGGVAPTLQSSGVDFVLFHVYDGGTVVRGQHLWAPA